MNKEQTKLADKAYKAFKALNDQYYKQRIQALVSVNEYGFAILILWSRIEITLKLLRYNLIIQNNQKSLWKTRDRIAHAAITITKEEYGNYKLAADYFLSSISQHLQPLNDYKAKMNRKRKK